MSYINAIRAADSASIDAFGRWRTSSPYSMFDSKQIFDKNPLFWDDAEVSGSGTNSVHNANTASTVLSVSANTAGKRVRQTKRWFNYQPGKSQQIQYTGTLDAGASGIERELGYFQDENGLFFRQTGTDLSVVVRGRMSGSPVDRVFDRSLWNLDPMNGNGPSGISLDASKCQIFHIDFEWLGVGGVRFGVIIDRQLYYVHEANHANNLAGVYMSTPNLPVRYSISNDGTGPAATLEHICTSVQSEGGQDETGVVLSAEGEATAANVAGTRYAIMGLRLKSTHLGATVINLTASMMSLTNNDTYRWELLLNPTVTGTFTYNGITNSAIEVASANANVVTVTGGTLIAAGHGAQYSALESVLNNTLNIGSTIAGVRDQLVLAFEGLGNSTDLDVYASMTWRELS